MSLLSVKHRGFLALSLVCWALCVGVLEGRAQPHAPRTSGEEEGAYLKAHKAINAWDIAEARAHLRALLPEGSPEGGLAAERGLSPVYDLMWGRVLLMEGRYEEATRSFDALKAALGEGAAPYEPLMREAYDAHSALKGMSEERSADGRFVVRYFEADRLMLPYLFDVLKAADQALSEDFNYSPPSPILVEVYPTADFLGRVSSLTVEEIETSGTIALCSSNRLMLTSPRGLARGYGWRDTIAHELVHYFVTKLTRNTVPIWLHEGIAKLQEVRWRGRKGPHLDPPQEDLLARSLEADQLITFDQMHPSMAKLPSQEAAGLAFAEVHMVVAYLLERRGYEGLRALLAALKEGASMDDALGASFGVSLSGLWEVWLAEMRGRGFKRYPGLVRRSLRFKRPGDEGEPEAEYDSIEEKEVKDWAHLGELLRARGKVVAALREYQKAAAKGGDAHIAVQSGMAASLIELKRFSEVPPVLERVRAYYPDFFNIHLYLGEAYLALGAYEYAAEAFEEAVGINPFHPTPHAGLERVYTQLNKTPLAARARRALEMMR
jgi:tetratricopeptide (TPR) repeat protein